jgi:hypothetical protein
MSKDVNIMFSDLSPEKQDEILEVYGITDPTEPGIDWHKTPLATVMMDEELVISASIVAKVSRRK